MATGGPNWGAGRTNDCLGKAATSTTLRRTRSLGPRLQLTKGSPIVDALTDMLTRAQPGREQYLLSAEPAFSDQRVSPPRWMSAQLLGARALRRGVLAAVQRGRECEVSSCLAKGKGGFAIHATSPIASNKGSVPQRPLFCFRKVLLREPQYAAQICRRDVEVARAPRV